MSTGAQDGGRRPRGGQDADAVRITSVAEPRGVDLARRNRRYLLQMTIRIVCFLGAVVVDHPVRWALLVGAVVLPYIAVVLANAGPERGTDPGTGMTARALPPAPTAGTPS